MSSHTAHNSDRQVADEHIYMDELSSQMDVKVSNFRRVPGLPVYGMAQPNTEVCGRLINFINFWDGDMKFSNA